MPSKRFVPAAKFIVATPYLIQRQFDLEKSEKSPKSVSSFQERNVARSEAFNSLASKEATAERLCLTKSCNRVIRDPHGNFGVCTRVGCTFAHSLDELRVPSCLFDIDIVKGIRCNRRPGANGSRTVCRFKHLDESTEEFRKRMGIVLPDLPETSEEVYKPVAFVPQPQEVGDASLAGQTE